MIAWFATVALAISSMASLNPPAPTPALAAAQEKQPANGEQSESHIKDPLSLKCRFKERQAEGEGEAQCEYSQPPADWWARVLTVLTLIAIVGQLVVYWWQARIMQRSLSAHRRPRFLIRGMHLKEVKNQTLNIECSLANAGDADGKIISVFTNTQLTAGENWQIMGGEDVGSQLHGQTFAAGRQVGWVFTIPVTLTTLGYLSDPASAPNVGLFLSGMVLYEDSFGVQRRTAFARRFNAKTKRFRADDDFLGEFEYAD